MTTSDNPDVPGVSTEPDVHDVPVLVDANAHANRLLHESLHDLHLRTRRAELVGVGAESKAVAALAELRSSTANLMTRAEYQKKIDEWLILRRRERSHARALIAVVTLFVIAVLGVGFYGIQASNAANIELSARQDNIDRVFYDSCVTRNAQLAEQERVYQQFIDIEKNDVDQTPSARDQKIEVYVNAVAALPSPIDCTSLRYGRTSRVGQ